MDTFFEVNRQELTKYMRPGPAMEDVKKTLNFSSTLESYRNNLLEQFDRLFAILTEDAEKHNVHMLRKAIKYYIKENYDKPLTCEILANEANLSSIYFSYLFKKSTGKNMTDYITEYRMDIAKNLLLDSEMSVYEVAAAVGFRDQRYFSKRFKQITGMTPTQFRRMK